MSCWVTLTIAMALAMPVAPSAALDPGPLGTLVTNILDNFVNWENYERTPYTIVKSTDDYEERFYPAKKWACTEGQVRDGEDIGSGMFLKLFDYIQGANAEGEIINMTVPITTKVSRDARTQILTHRMCFYIGKIHQAKPPQPTNTEVFIENRRSFIIFTRMKDGYMSDAAWNAEAQALSNILTNGRESFRTAPYWRVGYDSPVKFWDRRNEIWFSHN